MKYCPVLAQKYGYGDKERKLVVDIPKPTNFDNGRSNRYLTSTEYTPQTMEKTKSIRNSERPYKREPAIKPIAKDVHLGSEYWNSKSENCNRVFEFRANPGQLFNKKTNWNNTLLDNLTFKSKPHKSRAQQSMD